MNDDRHEPEVPELSGLARDIAPDERIESVVVGRLRDAGLIRRPRSAAWLLVAAAVVLAFGGGLFVGRETAAPPAGPIAAGRPQDEAPANAQAATASVPPGATITWF